MTVGVWRHCTVNQVVVAVERQCQFTSSSTTIMLRRVLGTRVVAVAAVLRIRRHLRCQVDQHRVDIPDRPPCMRMAAAAAAAAAHPLLSTTTVVALRRPMVVDIESLSFK